jgi:hypothetical protein
METSQDKEVSEAARLLGKRGGSKGGKAWATALIPEERQLIVRKAVTACWAWQKAKTEEAQGHD